jgi:hypothetical protein
MDKSIILVSLMAASTLLGGCVLPMSPLAHEVHVVTPLTNQTNVVVFKEAEVWWYEQALAPTQGIRFPEGTYQLEAEDSEYLFFRAPSQIEYRVLQNGKVTDDRFVTGGLCLSKKTFDLVPAGAYSFVDEHADVLTWKLGRDFMNMEGGRWTKNF